MVSSLKNKNVCRPFKLYPKSGGCRNDDTSERIFHRYVRVFFWQERKERRPPRYNLTLQPSRLLLLYHHSSYSGKKTRSEPMAISNHLQDSSQTSNRRGFVKKPRKRNPIFFVLFSSLGCNNEGWRGTGRGHLASGRLIYFHWLWQTRETQFINKHSFFSPKSCLQQQQKLRNHPRSSKRPKKHSFFHYQEQPTTQPTNHQIRTNY